MTIKVEMEVESYRLLKADKLVQVSGYVGDYQISIWLPTDDPRSREIMKAKQPYQIR
jgi:hypothetical protein